LSLKSSAPLYEAYAARTQYRLLDVKDEDRSRQYRFEGFRAAAQLEATIRVPSIDFTFKTDELETSSSDFAVMGTEVNGKYYEAAKA
jgi:hypothetical protein